MPDQKFSKDSKPIVWHCGSVLDCKHSKGASRMVTKTQLRERVAELRSMGFDISIEWAYGRPRCYSRDGSRELSPRLPTGEMAIWLNGFVAGASERARVEK